MQNTRLTLLQRAGAGVTEAWTELDGVYRPFIMGWFRTQSVAFADCDDLTQEVLTALCNELPRFNHSGNTGAFRTWLRGICLNRLLAYRRSASIRGVAVGGNAFQAQIQAISAVDPLVADWDQEHDQAILRYLFSVITDHFQSESLTVFRRLTLEGKTAAEVAAEFNTTPGAVYVIRSRVLRRLREEAERLLGEELPSLGSDPAMEP